MNEARRDRVVVLAQRIVILAGQADVFIASHDVGAAQWLACIVQAHQARVIRRNAHWERAFMALDRAAFVAGKAENSGQFIEGADAGAHLPAPVVPLECGGVGVEAAVKGLGVGADRKAQRTRPGGSCPDLRKADRVLDLTRRMHIRLRADGP